MLIKAKTKPNLLPEKNLKINKDIKAQLQEAKEQAAALIENAQLRAQKTLQKAEEELAAKLNEGFEQGYQKGFQEGKAQAEIEAQVKYEQIKKVLQEIYQLKNIIIEDTEKDLAGLSIAIAEKVIKRELLISSDTIFYIVKEASLELIQSDQITIFVHPNDGHIIQQKKSELQEILGEHAKIYIVNDETLEQGSCILESEHGYIDASLQTQLENIGMTILGAEI